MKSFFSIKGLFKRLSMLHISVSFIFSLCIISGYSKDTLNISGKSVILIEAETGKILYEKNCTELMQPASLTKLMTEYLVLEAIRLGRIQWEDKVSMSDYAFRIARNWNLSNVPVVKKNHKYSIRELFEAMAVFSSNTAAIMLAESISGSEIEFVKEMNSKAQKLGLDDCRFFDCTGLSNGKVKLLVSYSSGGNKMSARSIAKLAYRLIKDYPQVLEVSSIKNRYYKDNRNKQVRMNNMNWMIPGLRYGYAGVDGLKTGHTTSAGYCFAATVQKKDVRLISVVLNSKSRRSCFRQTRKLFDYGFSNFIYKEFYSAGYTIDLPIARSVKENIRLTTRTSLTRFIKKGEEKLYESSIELKVADSMKDLKLYAPVNKGQLVGYLEMDYKGEERYISLRRLKKKSVGLFAVEEASKMNWMIFVKRVVSEYFKTAAALISYD